ncbi:hypothetical protein [Microvirga splendida]|uniref:Uncharacterized protein n=1 Tax=Microvirga splendida TaxID=2795727 RepID=A0ABS0Y3Q4_9HYPH|nr:hypothetical protein [Microvirga splendida]MBJ6126943.1 hypothetical protein [Microvirga splendida]
MSDDDVRLQDHSRLTPACWRTLRTEQGASPSKTAAAKGFGDMASLG